MAINSVLKVKSGAELLSYIINQTPELASEIDLPVQGESIKPIGKIIVNNERYKNAFINTINLIGLTIIDRNGWQDPWETFTNRGMLNYGGSVRELFVDIAFLSWICSGFSEFFQKNEKKLNFFEKNP